MRFTNIKGNFISNYDSNTDLKLQINSNDFITLNATNNRIEIDRDVEMHSSSLKTNEIDTWTNANLVIKRNNVDFITLADGQINFNQPTNLNVDVSNLVKLTGEASQTIAGDIVVGGSLNTNTLNSTNDLILQRDGVEFMKLEGTLQSVEMTRGVKSNTYDSINNADVAFKRNFVDFF